jgi:uncharacterized protein YciI
MFIVELTYVVCLETVDVHLEAHVEYLKKYYAAGVFIASGRKEPRTGGIILATCASVEALRQVLADDPFNRHGVAEYSITEFISSMTAPEFACLAGI